MQFLQSLERLFSSNNGFIIGSKLIVTITLRVVLPTYHDNDLFRVLLGVPYYLGDLKKDPSLPTHLP